MAKHCVQNVKNRKKQDINVEQMIKEGMRYGNSANQFRYVEMSKISHLSMVVLAFKGTMPMDAVSFSFRMRKLSPNYTALRHNIKTYMRVYLWLDLIDI